MEPLQLTFPVFYDCAIHKAGSLTQYDAVNLLLTGCLQNDSSNLKSIPSPTVNNYVKGAKPLPRAMIDKLLRLPDEELLRRFEELNFPDVAVIGDATARLLDKVSLSSARRNQLLQYYDPDDDDEYQVYDFLIEVFRVAVKNSSINTVKLIDKNDAAYLALIKSCRDPNFRPAEETYASRKTEETPASPPEKSRNNFLIVDEEPVRNIGTISPHVKFGKTNITESILKYMAELNQRDDANPLEPLGYYDDQLLMRALYPSEEVGRQDLVSAFCKLLEDDETTHLPISELELQTAMQTPEIRFLYVLECMGRDIEVLHYLSGLSRLREVKQAAMVISMAPNGHLELASQFQRAVMDSMRHTNLLSGIRLMPDIDVGYVCVQLLLGC